MTQIRFSVHPLQEIIIKWSLLTQFVLHKELQHFFQQTAPMDSHKHKYRSHWTLAIPLKS